MIIWSFVLLFSQVALAAEVLEPILVQGGVDGRRIDTHEIHKTEVLGRKRIQQKQAHTLVEAVAKEVGVDAQTSCANCGSKRLTINGMRGEHTTVLADGVPAHSAVSAFYGMDAIPTGGIERIEISRGAGGYLIAPEAIGGVVNIVTLRATKNEFTFDTNAGNNNVRYLGLTQTLVGDGGKNRAVIAAQASQQGFWDLDGNGIAEAPTTSNRAVLGKFSRDLNASDNIEVRYSHQFLGILGGTTTGHRPSGPRSATTTLPAFDGTNVQNPYRGEQDRITDRVDLTRHEGMLRWKHRHGEDYLFQATTSLVSQRQDSIYNLHGYDYQNQDLIWFNDLRLVMADSSSDHVLTVGIESKDQSMDSSSAKLYGQKNLAQDDFKYTSRALYLEDVWSLSPSAELSWALRADKLHVQWSDPRLSTRSLEEWLIAPRAHFKLLHDEAWTSRLSYSRGYRPPLSFFESQHGLNENGFLIQISSIEKSHSVGYSLDHTRENTSVTVSSYYTSLENMAYADNQINIGESPIFRNAQQTFGVWSNDIVFGFNPTSNWRLQTSYEKFSYESRYKRLMPVAAIEDRIRFTSDYHIGDWEIISDLTWVGARNLSDYGYNQHYKNLKDELIDASDPGLGTETRPNERKRTDAPAFFTLDLLVSKPLQKNLSAYAGVQNVFDYTQTAAGDSPLNWSQHGTNPAHFHLDNNHVWGPTRGRLITLGLRGNFE